MPARLSVWPLPVASLPLLAFPLAPLRPLFLASFCTLSRFPLSLRDAFLVG